MKRVIAIQISGNKSVDHSAFKQSVQALAKDGYHIDLITNNKAVGLTALSDSIETYSINYKPSAIKFVNSLRFLVCQVQLFFLTWKLAKTADTIYINSIYQFGAALAGKLNNAKVIYHLHNAPVRFGFTEKMATGIINHTAEQVIFTSANLKDRLHLTAKKQNVIYHTPTRSFIDKAAILESQGNSSKRFTVLMICELSEEKGIDVFVELALELPEIKFNLVLTQGHEEAEHHKLFRLKPANLYIYNESENLHPYYEKASMVVNLSKTNEYLESCDINILQAMYYGKPVIVPANGGLKELISPKKHGVAIDSMYMEAISITLSLLSKNDMLYKQLSEACKEQARLFNPENFSKQICSLFGGYKQPVYSNINQLFGQQFLIAN